ncbi:Translation Initiation factor eIF- 4e [Carpediemonas membranifera]|uniref:Translation Initiation factor eIF- 4e n=1 Tax=Carpediemonas membranifera TaxID=201153 RepID=A0A8J6AXM8_9EUKA|nr:Translation Initiation factor eIF- 4e [Carpediemonas membranifera]|eukprot:KAG9397366.1 Translation Initiation factor eIF- 4e [Carpediemonas membranifera]
MARFKPLQLYFDNNKTPHTGISASEYQVRAAKASIACCRTEEEFDAAIRPYMNISALDTPFTVKIFEEGVPPTWEAPQNIDGGHLSFLWPTGEADIQKNWESVIDLFIKRRIEAVLLKHVTGVCLSVKAHKATFTVWTSIIDQRYINALRRALRRRGLYSGRKMKFTLHHELISSTSVAPAPANATPSPKKQFMLTSLPASRAMSRRPSTGDLTQLGDDRVVSFEALLDGLKAEFSSIDSGAESMDADSFTHQSPGSVRWGDISDLSISATSSPNRSRATSFVTKMKPNLPFERPMLYRDGASGKSPSPGRDIDRWANLRNGAHASPRSPPKAPSPPRTIKPKLSFAAAVAGPTPIARESATMAIVVEKPIPVSVSSPSPSFEEPQPVPDVVTVTKARADSNATPGPVTRRLNNNHHGRGGGMGPRQGRAKTVAGDEKEVKRQFYAMRRRKVAESDRPHVLASSSSNNNTHVPNNPIPSTPPPAARQGFTLPSGEAEVGSPLVREVAVTEVEQVLELKSPEPVDVNVREKKTPKHAKAEKKPAPATKTGKTSPSASGKDQGRTARKGKREAMSSGSNPPTPSLKHRAVEPATEEEKAWAEGRDVEVTLKTKVQKTKKVEPTQSKRDEPKEKGKKKKRRARPSRVAEHEVKDDEGHVDASDDGLNALEAPVSELIKVLFFRILRMLLGAKVTAAVSAGDGLVLAGALGAVVLLAVSVVAFVLVIG